MTQTQPAPQSVTLDGVHVAYRTGGDPGHGSLAFQAHGLASGFYRGWLQVRRADRVHVLPLGVRIPGIGS